MEITWQIWAWAVVSFIPMTFVVTWLTGVDLTGWTDSVLATVFLLGATLVACGLLGLDRATGLFDGLAAVAVLIYGMHTTSRGLQAVLTSRPQ
ncbi:hypothetical protein [Solimonas sp. SE-A11]|uniref:hypothetical protein n=1 Tax=Solimonas sp. SE-A11 TaxID=3054954 RepID=UPI00259C9EDE|nr:hypothetical protein [Solimonas sp. SE-A11]MDM4770912.1 hypothetical protein [Solimonas sp. SE-A11]